MMSRQDGDHADRCSTDGIRATFISRASTAAALACLVACLTLLPAGCNQSPTQAPPPTTKTLTAESGTLKFEFTYPLDWQVEPTPTAEGVTLAAVLVPADREPGTRIEFALIDGEQAAKAIRNLPLIPPGATIVSNGVVDIDGHKFHRVEWRGDLHAEPTYRHEVGLQGDIGRRFVILRGYTGAPRGQGDDANKRFEKRRQEFEAALLSARIAGQP